MKKISKNELLAILALAGVSSGNAALATNSNSNNESGSLGKVEHARPAYLADDKSKCGKGSCGKDEKGAAAAKGKHAKTKKDSKTDPKTDSKDDAKKKSDKN